MSKKKANKRPWNWEQRIMTALRRVWRFSDARREALGRAAHPETRHELLCASCGSWTHHKLCAVDHVRPIVPVTGFDSWDAVIVRLTTGELQVLCDPCHKAKTKAENAERAANRRAKKGKKV